MSDHAGILCNANDVRSALDAARALNESIRQQGVAYDGRLRGLARAAVAADRAPLRSRPHGARVLCRARRRQPRRPGPLRPRRGSHAYGSHRSSRGLPVCFRATRRPRPADTRSPEGGDFHLRYAAGATSRSRLPAVLRARLARLPDRRDPQSRQLRKTETAVTDVRLESPSLGGLRAPEWTREKRQSFAIIRRSCYRVCHRRIRGLPYSLKRRRRCLTLIDFAT